MKERDFHPFSPAIMQSQLSPFMEKIEQLSHIIGLPLDTLSIDHVAMRINDVVQAEQTHFMWNDLGTVISDAEINGRPIIVIKLFRPLSLGKWKTTCLEIPYPLPGKDYPAEGWEHVECVVPSKCVSCDDYLLELKRQFPELKSNWHSFEKQGLTVKLSAPKGEGELLPNPTIAFKWQNVCIKLHPHALEQVIRSEQHHLYPIS